MNKQGYLAHRKLPLPQDFRRALDIGLLQGPRGALFLMNEVILQSQGRVLHMAHAQKETRRLYNDLLVIPVLSGSAGRYVGRSGEPACPHIRVKSLESSV